MIGPTLVVRITDLSYITSITFLLVILVTTDKLLLYSKKAGFSRSLLPYKLYTVTCRSDYRGGFGLVNRFVGYSEVVNMINYNILRITVIII
jgi:hypothetical protein